MKILNIVRNKIDEKIIWENLSLVGLKDYHNYFAKELSVGMRERKSITFTGNIMLFDKDFKSLDIKLKETTINILFVTHDIEKALYVCDRVLILNGQSATISKKINLLKRKKEKNLSIEDEVELKRKVLKALD